ncbi:MAG: molybdopterin-synthase adenylyltransferase MoeB [Candidatus Sumerlaeia bacterium]|nr:molybdopterin-synthase adenylyltransferase MoeB [Candidatus Sumerlaeia bacterium]
MPQFTQEQMERYSRHILIPGFGGVGQQRLLDAKVLVLGAGGLGSPALLYLAAAGIGTIGIVDGDCVDLSNLQRQIIHRTADIGRPKALSAQETLTALNPGVRIIVHSERMTGENAAALIAPYDAVVDGTDNFPTRFLANDACFFARRPLFTAAVFRFEGQLTSFLMQGSGPCYRCLFPEPPPPGLIPTCQEAGILGSVTGVLGTLLATEVIKHFAQTGEGLEGTLLLCDLLTATFRRVRFKRNPACPLCGDAPAITRVTGHSPVCGTR